MSKRKVDPACPSCMRCVFQGVIRREAVQRLPQGVGVAPLDNDGNPWCHDCASAETVSRLESTLTWEMARTAVGNDRQDQYRLPGAPMGLAYRGLIKLSEPGDLEKQIEWLHEIGLYIERTKRSVG